MRIAFFIGIILFFFPVSYALQEPLAESSVYEPRAQSTFSELLRTILELMDSIITFISLVPGMISVTLDALSRLAAGELRYTDVAWCFDIIRVLARGLGLSQTYGAFVNAVMALTTGSLTVDDVYEILRVLPPLMRETPGAIARWASMAYNVGFELVFAPIAGLITGSVIGGIAGGAIFVFSILFFSIITFFCLSAIAMILSIGIAIGLAVLAIAIFIGIDIFLLIAVFVFVVSVIIIGIILGLIMGGFVGAIIGGGVVGFVFILITIILWVFGFIWTFIALFLWLIALVVSAVIGALIFGAIFALIFGAIAFVISVIGIGIAIAIELFLLFVALPALILFIFAALIFIGALLALPAGLIVGLPVGAISGGILGLIAFLVITPILIILFFIGYPLMRWASLTGALQPI